MSRKKLTYNKEMIKSFHGWTFWDYVSPSGNNKIEEWCENELLETGRLMFLKLIKAYRRTENHLDWLGFKKKPIVRGSEKIWEICFHADGRANRILMTFHGEKVAVLLMGCYHKGRVYTPHDAIEEAFRRKKLLMRGEATHEERLDR